MTASPNQIFGREETEVTLTGSGFDKNLKIKVGTDEIAGYTLVDSKTIRFKINPTGSGLLDIVLKTSEGKESALKQSLLAHPVRPVWRGESGPSKKSTDPMTHFLIDQSTNQFVSVINRGDIDGSVLLWGPTTAMSSGAHFFGAIAVDPPCLAQGNCIGNEGGGTYASSVKSLAIDGSSGEYFVIVDYKNTDTRGGNVSSEIYHFRPGNFIKTFIPLPSASSKFYSDINQRRIYALAVTSNSVNLWEWKDDWKPLLALENQSGPFLQNPVLIANIDPGDPFICLAYEEQSASCSRAGGDWKKISFVELTSGKKITSFAYDPKNKVLLIATEMGEIYASFRGAPWVYINRGPELGTRIDNLAYHPMEDRFYAVLNDKIGSFSFSK